MSTTEQSRFAPSLVPYQWGNTVIPLGVPTGEDGLVSDLQNALPVQTSGPLIAQIIKEILDIDGEVSQVLARPTKRIVAVNDVFHDPHDTDARLTVDVGNHAVPTEKHYVDPAALPYIAELICLLRDDELWRVAAIIDEHRTLHESFYTYAAFLNGVQAIWSIIPVDIQRRIFELLNTTERINLNSAARNLPETAHDVDHAERSKNGPDYYLAITDTGIEFTVTPLSILQYIKDDIVAIFRIPDGIAWPVGEQFRSRLVALFGHTYPHKLIPVWQKGKNNKNELHQLVPDESSDPRIGYIDSFHNRRIRVRNLREFWGCVTNNIREGMVYLGVGSTTVQCIVGANLTSVPGGNHAIYLNPADQQNGGPGYVEFTRRLSDGASITGTWESGGRENPSTKLDSADRGLGVLVRILSSEEGEKRLSFNDDSQCVSQF